MAENKEQNVDVKEECHEQNAEKHECCEKKGEKKCGGRKEKLLEKSLEEKDKKIAELEEKLNDLINKKDAYYSNEAVIKIKSSEDFDKLYVSVS
jgi:hypothetical protein